MNGLLVFTVTLELVAIVVVVVVAGPVPLRSDDEMAAAYQAPGTPSGYLIDAEGKIASEFAITVER